MDRQGRRVPSTAKRKYPLREGGGHEAQASPQKHRRRDPGRLTSIPADCMESHLIDFRSEKSRRSEGAVRDVNPDRPLAG